MLEKLRRLAVNDLITIDSEIVQNYTNKDDFTICENRFYTHDNGELSIMTIDDFYLLSHNLEDGEKSFLCELYKQGDLTVNYLEDEEFMESIELDFTYEQSNMESIYDAAPYTSGDDVSFAEYFNENLDLIKFAFIERTNYHVCVYQGFQIETDDVVI